MAMARRATLAQCDAEGLLHFVERKGAPVEAGIRISIITHRERLRV
jgi:hypothetical protein